MSPPTWWCGACGLSPLCRECGVASERRRKALAARPPRPRPRGRGKQEAPELEAVPQVSEVDAKVHEELEVL